jgi:hypothetical protein
MHSLVARWQRLSATTRRLEGSPDKHRKGLARLSPNQPPSFRSIVRIALSARFVTGQATIRYPETS